MNILLIDYLSCKGHRKFNRIHINTLLSLNHDLILLGKNGQFVEYQNTEHVHILDLPFNSSGRLYEALNLLWINHYIHRHNYNVIVFLTYDNISIGLFRSKTPTLLFNHNNVGQLDNTLKGRIKKFLVDRLPQKSAHICLNKEMEDRMRELFPKRTVFYIPHGLITVQIAASMPEFLSEGEKYIICPINRNYDSKYVDRLFHSEYLLMELKKRSISLLVKQKLLNAPISDPIKIIPDVLDDAEYHYLLSNASAVLLPYSEDFKYRCSGIFFECVAEKVPIIASKIPAMTSYLGTCDIQFFSNPNTLVNCIDNLDRMDKSSYNMKLFNTSHYWKQVLNNYIKSMK